MKDDDDIPAEWVEALEELFAEHPVVDTDAGDHT